MADSTSLYSSPEPRVYSKKISLYLNLEIIVIRKLCPNGKCLAVTLLFGNHGLTLFWGVKRYQTCLTNKIFCWSKFVVVQILSNAIERGETRCPRGKRLETKQPVVLLPNISRLNRALCSGLLVLWSQDDNHIPIFFPFATPDSHNDNDNKNHSSSDTAANDVIHRLGFFLLCGIRCMHCRCRCRRVSNKNFYTCNVGINSAWNLCQRTLNNGCQGVFLYDSGWRSGGKLQIKGHTCQKRDNRYLLWITRQKVDLILGENDIICRSSTSRTKERDINVTECLTWVLFSRNTK